MKKLLNSFAYFLSTIGKIKRNIFAFPLIIFSTFAYSQTDTVNITASATVSACQQNIFTATFTANGSSFNLSIHDSLNYNGHFYPSTCDSGGSAHITSLHVLSSFPSLTLSYDSATASWITGNITGFSGTVSITYSAWIDCGLLHVLNDTSTAPIDFVQQWSDLNSNYNFYFLSSGINEFKSPNILVPFLVDITDQVFPGRIFKSTYHQTIPIYFFYRNNGTTAAHIRFTFDPNGAGHCSSDLTVSLHYAIGDTGKDLYSKLKQDSASYSGDAVLMQFKQSSDTGTTGRLYEVRNTISTISVLDSSTLLQIATTDSSIVVNTESLRVLDSISAADTSIDNSIQHESLIADLNNLQQSRKDLIAPYHAAEPINLAQSIAINNTASAVQLPEQNEQALNQIAALFYLYGVDTLYANYSIIESIAVQCPYAGGKAVYRARTFMEMMNDTMDYDDRNTCAQSGVFRKPTVLNTPLTHSIKIIPNPANEKIEIILLGEYEGMCNLVLRNAIGEEIYNGSLDCKKKSTHIDISDFSSGVYYVQVYVNQLPLQFEKLVIVR
jgi:hypothetical protein